MSGVRTDQIQVFGSAWQTVCPVTDALNQALGRPERLFVPRSLRTYADVCGWQSAEIWVLRDVWSEQQLEWLQKLLRYAPDMGVSVRFL